MLYVWVVLWSLSLVRAYRPFVRRTTYVVLLTWVTWLLVLLTLVALKFHLFALCMRLCLWR